MTDAYVCARCGGRYISDRSEDETRVEARALFDGIRFDDDTAVLCHDCWPQFIEWMHETYGPPPWPYIPPDDG